METLHPGLYFQEVAGTPPVEGVSTATAGFVGITSKGRVGEAVLVTNWSQFVNEFGGFINDSYLAYAVRGFFENGGSRAYIVRAVHYDVDGDTGTYTKTSDVATTQLLAGTEPVLNVDAKSDGTWGNDIKVEVLKGEAVDKFTLNVYYKGTLVESYKEVDMETIEIETKTSSYIEVIVKGDTVPDETPKTALVGGKDGIRDMTDEDYKYSLKAFDAVQVNLIAIPGVTSIGVQKGLFDYATARGDVFAVTEVPMGLGVKEARDYVVKEANLSTEFGAIYYPFIRVSDPIGLGKNPTKLIPPSGHIIGAIARTDNSIGVWRAPAGTDVKLLGTIGLEYNISDAEQDILNPENINAIRAFDGEGICIWGTRTLSGGEYKYIPVRRLVIFIEQSLKANMLWTVFKPNDEKLWGMIKSAVEGFLTTIWAQGGLKGASASEAFFVKCDAELNTPDVIDQGITYVDIGIAPQKPAEFIVFRISLKR
jgi:phage tail sheath protein FI